ncbi:MAG TPA: Crp/Fnr family transcriptional regulator [Terracidiphilus sp.]|nr:Crp/Fnr family transcriptional regulator [Terracidiphilus sp.]
METMLDTGIMCRNDRAIRTGEFFSNWSPDALDEWAEMERAHSYGPNIVLFSERGQARGLFVVLEGEIRLSINSSEGKRLSLRIARKGDVLGLSSALSGTPYEVTAETLYPSKVAPIGRDQFMAFLTRHPELYRNVTDELSRHVSMACHQLRTVGLSSSAPEKLARLLLEWSENEHSTSACARVRFSLTHEEIGEFIGASRETVTRTLSTFKHRRLVLFHGSMLEIPSRTALASYAGA